MFKEIFIRLCNDKKVSPSFVCRQIGLSNAAYSCWTDESVPRRATLQKLADYFGVSVDYLLGNEKKPSAASTEDLQLNERERQLVIAYRQQPALQYAVDRLLGIGQDGLGQTGRDLA